MSDKNFKFTKKIQTYDRLLKVMSAVDDLLLSVPKNLKYKNYHYKDSKSGVNLDAFDFEVKSFFNWLFEQEEFFLLEDNNLEEVFFLDCLKDFREKLEKVEKLDLVVAFDPDFDTKSKIINWIHENIGENMVINFTVDPSILSGAKISFKGRYIDLTSKKRLNNFFANKSFDDFNFTKKGNKE